MILEHAKAEVVERQILNVIGRHLDLKFYHVFFFGSRVTGKGTDRSDIDIGIEGTEPISRHLIAQIKEEIDHLDYLYSFDVVDFKKVSKDFYKVAKQMVQPLN